LAPRLKKIPIGWSRPAGLWLGIGLSVLLVISGCNVSVPDAYAPIKAPAAIPSPTLAPVEVSPGVVSEYSIVRSEVPPQSPSGYGWATPVPLLLPTPFPTIRPLFIPTPALLAQFSTACAPSLGGVTMATGSVPNCYPTVVASLAPLIPLSPGQTPGPNPLLDMDTPIGAALSGLILEPDVDDQEQIETLSITSPTALPLASKTAIPTAAPRR
jgi:hypothetical protein